MAVHIGVAVLIGAAAVGGVVVHPVEALVVEVVHLAAAEQAGVGEMTDKNRSNVPRLFFSKEELQRIAEAIAGVEEKTSAEIRIRLERKCEGEPLERTRT